MQFHTFLSAVWNSGWAQEFNFLEGRNRESALCKIHSPTKQEVRSKAGSSHGSAQLELMSKRFVAQLGSSQNFRSSFWVFLSRSDSLTWLIFFHTWQWWQSCAVAWPVQLKHQLGCCQNFEPQMSQTWLNSRLESDLKCFPQLHHSSAGRRIGDESGVGMDQIL